MGKKTATLDTKTKNIPPEDFDLHILAEIQEQYSSKELIRIAHIMDARIIDPLLIYPINDNYSTLSKSMHGIHILFGGASNGRKSSVYWANKTHNYHVLQIDANIYATQNQFIEKLVMEGSKVIGEEDFGKKLIIDDQITFRNLGKLIKQNKTIIIVDNAERLVEPKRQTILYTMLEWVKEEDTKENVILFLVTKNAKFTDNLEKRVKSRLTANYLFYHGTPPEGIIKILQARLSGSNVSYSLQQTLLSTFNSPQVKKKLLYYHSLGKSICFFLNWIKCTICGLNPDLLRSNPNQHFLQILQKSEHWMSPNVGLCLLTNMTFPEIIFMSLVSLMIKGDALNLNLDLVLKQYVKVKQQYLDSKGVGSTFNYSDVIMERAFNKLIDHKLLAVDDTMEVFRFAPVLLNINRDEMEMELLKIDKLPMFIKSILMSDYLMRS